MADEALAQAGLHFDELNKIRVLEPEVFQQTTELKEECKDFVESEYWWADMVRIVIILQSLNILPSLSINSKRADESKDYCTIIDFLTVSAVVLWDGSIGDQK